MDIVLGGDCGAQPIAQPGRVEQVHDPHPVTALNLVAVRRADSAASGADLDPVLALFAGLFQCLVVGHDHVGDLADEETAGHRKTPGLEVLDLGQHRLRVDDHTVAHHASFVLVHNTRGDHVEDEFGVPNDNGMAGVGPTLIAHHHVGFEREIIDDLGLALVAPLRAQYDFRRHNDLPKD